MISRELSPFILEQAKKMPVVALTGPRQSGKTTLVKSVFPDYTYLNLEFPDVRARALEDPRLFLQTDASNLILDEIQRAPELFSYIQGFVDDRQKSGQYILIGSQNFLLLQSISQSLAGRVSLLDLLPLSLAEINSKFPLPDYYAPVMYKGGYPRLKAIEIKSGMTINADFFKGLDFWKRLTGVDSENCFLIYGGDEDQKRNQATVLGWKHTHLCLDV